MAAWDELARKIDRHHNKDVEPCQNNPAIMCEGPGQRCEKCGWNPRTEWKRINRIRKEFANEPDC